MNECKRDSQADTDRDQSAQADSAGTGGGIAHGGQGDIGHGEISSFRVRRPVAERGARPPLNPMAPPRSALSDICGSITLASSMPSSQVIAPKNLPWPARTRHGNRVAIVIGSPAFLIWLPVTQEGFLVDYMS